MTWVHLWNRKHTLQQDYLGRLIWFLDNPYFVLKNILVVPVKNQKADYYCQDDEWEKLMKKLAAEINKPRFIDKILKRFVADRRMFVRVAKKINNAKNLRRQSNKGLLKLYQEIIQAHLRFTYFFWSPWAVNEITVPKFEQQLKVRFGKGAEKIFNAVTTPTRRNIMEEQLYKLHRYQAGGILAKKINAHVKKYEYLAVYSLLDKPFNKKDFLSFILSKSAAKEALMNDSKMWQNRRREFKTAMSYLKPYPGLYQVAQVLNCYAWLRTLRVEAWREILFLMQPFFHELERRMGLDYNQAPHLTYDEIVNFLSKGVGLNKNLIGPDNLMYLHNGVLRIIRDKWEITKVLNKELKFSNYTKVKKVTGNVACRGKVVGKVKIVMLPEDCRLLKRGEILVSNMTHPDYLLGMRKAAAFVTDEGGISSHAAIVARELNKPCIIGTKIATKVFKDGDLVEVDAINGIIKKV